MLKYLLEKEFKQFMRNRFLPKLLLIMPVVMLMIMPWAADLNTKNVNLAVVDHDRSPFSVRFAAKATAARYFNLAGNAASYAEALEMVENGEADVILEIPRGFERDLVKRGASRVMISANAVNGTKGSLGSIYLSRIAAGFAEEITAESGTRSASMIVDVVPAVRYNPTMDYKKYMVPAFMVVLLTLICGFFPALNVVMEKETGTIEQINVTPIGRFTFILAKLILYWLAGVVVLTMGLLVAWLMYGIVPAGSYLSVYAAFILYVIAISGFGIVVSNHSATMQQAMFVMFFFMIIFILMSGMFTPINSMPAWAQNITIINPLRYFISIMRSIFFKASSVADLRVQYLALAGFAVAANVWAVASYRKRN